MDIDGTVFPGSGMRKTQELNEGTHLSLRLNKTMVSVPRVELGDHIHCEFFHIRGLGVALYDSYVFAELLLLAWLQGIVMSQTLRANIKVNPICRTYTSLPYL